MVKQRFSVRAVQMEELKTVGALLALTRHELEANWWREQWPRLEPLRPGFSLAHHRVGVLNGHIVAHVSVWPRTLTYGSAHLKVAAFSRMTNTQPQAVAPDYPQAVIRDALTYAAEQRAHLALRLLEGEDLSIQELPRYNFHAVMPVYRAEFQAGQLADLRTLLASFAARPAPSLTLRPARLQDAPYLAAIFQRQWSGRLTFARSPELWLWRMQGAEAGRRALVVVAADDDRPQGYIAGVGGDGVGGDAAALLTGHSVEVVANTPQAALTLLAAAGEAAVQRGQARVHWLLPPDDGLIALAQRYVDVTLSAQYSPVAGWRGRVLNGQALVEALLPELRSQLRLALPQADYTKLDVIFGAEGVVIGLTGQRETLSHLHQSDFVQLLFGAVSPMALALRENLSEASVRLLQALFPVRIGVFGAWDWF